MSPNRIAFYSSNGFAETFTRAHIEKIEVEYVLTGGSPPKFVNDVFMLPMGKFSLLKRKLISLFSSRMIAPDYPLNFFLRKHKPDILIAEFGTSGSSVVRACKENAIPLMVNFYGIDAFGHEVQKKYKNAYTEMFSYASAFSVQSQSIKRELIRIGCPEHKIVVNSCPPDPSFFELTPDFRNRNIVAVGRFVEKKSPLTTIHAFRQVLQEMPDARLIFAGDGPLLEESKALVNSFGIADKVTFSGRISPEEQRKIYSSASLFVQHSVVAPDGDAEGLPVAIMEASAAGLPVVSTIHSGIPEAVLQNETGILVQEHDINGMSDAMIRLLNNPEQAKRMGAAGKFFMRSDFTMEKHIRVMKETISNVINNARN